jgi:radical SAM-linked protein
MNNIKGVSCDRSFAPAPDFEKLLREKNLPLYGLDTGISLASVDLLMFTLGYELGLNGILTMLNASGIPLHCSERKSNGEGKDYPIIIAGGPAVSNPLPYSPFIDAFWIGEAEAGFFELADELAKLKKAGQGRAALLEKISLHPNIWVRGKEKTLRAIYNNFSTDSTTAAVFPIPSMKIIQNHGAVEIMRGCPNGCRFCHAGFWYRPQREKDAELIISQVNEMVMKGGWQEISLSSLSSGDYSNIAELVENLNTLFSNLHVSFQLPSLKVSTFTLSLLEKISVTRKSGLTFAVETPKDSWQMSINKEVTRDSVVAIIEEAKRSGWKGAKFYFLIGLPVEDKEKSEEEEIVSFIIDVGRRTRMHFNINVGIFIPKPHTPYQWASQLNSETAERKLNFIRSSLKPFGHKVSISDPLISRIEGLLSRGDERSGYLCEEAWSAGSRLDPWSEFIDREKWLEIMEKNPSYVDSVFSAKKEQMPWEQVDSCVTGEYIKQELEKSNNSLRTVPCNAKCTQCGVCKGAVRRKNTAPTANLTGTGNLVNHKKTQVNQNNAGKSDPPIYRVLFGFSKEGSAVFHGHLSLIEIFSMSFRRAAIPVVYTQGFNPLAKMEFASPLATGISADCEIAAVDFTEPVSTEGFIEDLNKNLPQGICIKRAESFFIKSGMKKHSLSSLLWGFSYANNEGIDLIDSKEEKVYRQKRLETDCKSLFSLRRCEVLAKKTADGDTNEGASYFDVYRGLYPHET